MSQDFLSDVLCTVCFLYIYGGEVVFRRETVYKTDNYEEEECCFLHTAQFSPYALSEEVFSFLVDNGLIEETGGSEDEFDSAMSSDPCKIKTESWIYVLSDEALERTKRAIEDWKQKHTFAE